MKRHAVLMITVFLVFSLLTGCGNAVNVNTGSTETPASTSPGSTETPASAVAESTATPINPYVDSTETPENNSGGTEKWVYTGYTEDDPEAADLPKVYMTSDISPDGLMAVYEALGRPAEGKTAIKLHMGEPGNNYYLSPDLLKDLVLSVDGTFVDCNTYYGGLRGNTKAHLQAAKDHGFTYAPVDILDSEGEIALPVEGGRHLKAAIVGSHYSNYDFIISIAHFKGHQMAGFGGTFKNIAVGMSSVNGKKAIHDDPGGYMFSSDGNTFLEKIVEAAKAVIDDKGDKIVYINVMNNLSIDCDCNGAPQEPKMQDIGILGSLDPVALDKACVDLVYNAPEEQRKDLVMRIEFRNGLHTLKYAEELGLGSQKYVLVNLDD